MTEYVDTRFGQIEVAKSKIEKLEAIIKEHEESLKNDQMTSERSDKIRKEIEQKREEINQQKEVIDTTVKEIQGEYEKMGIKTDKKLKIITAVSVGVAIASAIVAIILSTIIPMVQFIKGKAPDASTPRRLLKKLADILRLLGKKALYALPGIIGTIVSYLFRGVAKVVETVSKNIWMLFMMAGVLIFEITKQIYNKKYKK